LIPYPYSEESHTLIPISFSLRLLVHVGFNLDPHRSNSYSNRHFRFKSFKINVIEICPAVLDIENAYGQT